MGSILGKTQMSATQKFWLTNHQFCLGTPTPLISFFDLAFAPDLRWYTKLVAIWCSEAFLSQLRQKSPKNNFTSLNYVQKAKNSILANITKSWCYILGEVVLLRDSHTKGVEKSQFQINRNLWCLSPVYVQLFVPRASRFFTMIDFVTESTIKAHLSKVWHFRGVQIHSPGFLWNL